MNTYRCGAQIAQIAQIAPIAPIAQIAPIVWIASIAKIERIVLIVVIAMTTIIKEMNATIYAYEKSYWLEHIMSMRIPIMLAMTMCQILTRDVQ